MITALGVEALHRAELIAKQADIVAALSIDVLQGTPRAFEAGITARLHLEMSPFQQPIDTMGLSCLDCSSLILEAH